jgi:membrane-associated phospholipid phosphatase
MIVIWDFISLLIIAIAAYPFIRYIETLECTYLIIVAGVVFCQVFIKLTRQLHSLKIYKFMIRPKGACNCNIMNSGGSYENRIGMPSGHMLMTTYVIVSLILLNPTILTISLGSIVIILMGCSRYYKLCHTVPQVVVGITVGIIFAYITNIIIKKL